MFGRFPIKHGCTGISKERTADHWLPMREPEARGGVIRYSPMRLRSPGTSSLVAVLAKRPPDRTIRVITDSHLPPPASDTPPKPIMAVPHASRCYRHFSTLQNVLLHLNPTLLHQPITRPCTVFGVLYQSPAVERCQAQQHPLPSSCIIIAIDTG